MKPITAALFAVLLAAMLLPAGSPRVYRSWTKAELVDLAAVHASKLDKSQAKFVRYIDLSAVAPAGRAAALKALGFVLSSFSLSDEISPCQEVPGSEGALAFVDLSTLRAKGDDAGLKQLLLAYENVGELGSGPAPFPEPYYHLTVDTVVKATEVKEEYTVPVKVTVLVRDQYGNQYYREETRRETRVRVKKTPARAVRQVLVGPQLNEATALGLTALTGTSQPIYEFRWLCANALYEPRYHELLGLDDSVDSVKKLSGVDERTADLKGAQARGVVLRSEVALRNRALERTPLANVRYGRGAFNQSSDFKTSVRKQDVMKDLLLAKVDAHEIIWSLPNGLPGYFVVNGDGVRLDKADSDVAVAKRLKFRDPQVRTALACMACHMPEKGWIEVDDAARRLALKPVKLYADALDENGRARGERIRQKYLSVDFNELLRADQAVVEVAVRSATTGPDGRSLTCAETARVVVESARSYLDDDLSLAQLSLELGYPQADVLKALSTKGLDPVFAEPASAGKGRRDQTEAGFAQIATVLRKGTYK